MAGWSFAAALAGASLGGLAAISVQFFKYHIDGVVARCGDLVVALRAMADLSTEYWLSDFSSASTEAVDAKPEAAQKELKGRLIEAKIRGYQQLILSEVHILIKILPDNEANRLSSLRVNFIDAVSGADFLERDGTANKNQAISSQIVISDMIHSLQSAKVSCVSISYIFERFIEHKKRMATATWEFVSRKTT